MLRRICAIFVLFFPLYASCSDAAVAIASGNVHLNGNTLVRSSTVLDGDELVTGTNAAVVLHGNGFSLQIGPDTTFSLQKHELLLPSGSLLATGRAEIVAGTVFVASRSAGTKFVVSHIERTVHVLVLAGSVQVHRASEEVSLNAGQSKTFTDDSPQAAMNHGRRNSALIALGGGAAVASATVIASHLEDAEQPCISSCGFSTRR